MHRSFPIPSRNDDDNFKDLMENRGEENDDVITAEQFEIQYSDFDITNFQGTTTNCL